MDSQKMNVDIKKNTHSHQVNEFETYRSNVKESMKMPFNIHKLRFYSKLALKFRTNLKLKLFNKLYIV